LKLKKERNDIMKIDFIKKITGLFTLAAIIVSSFSFAFADVMVNKEIAFPAYSKTVIINDKGVQVVLSNENNDISSVAEKINNIKNNILNEIDSRFEKWNLNILNDKSDDDLKNDISDTNTADTHDIICSEYITKVIEITNVERSKYNLVPLKLSNALCKSAQEHADDMYINGYFSHTSQDGRTMSDRINKYCSGYMFMGENIAKGYGTPEAVVNGWMNSEGHRANILNGDFTEIGVGYNESGSLWVQNFGG